MKSVNDIMRIPKCIDLFSGCGGLTEGLKQAGFKVIGAIDNDKISVDTYKRNHKNVIVWNNDIQNVDPKAIMKKLDIRKGQLDLLAACPPCQGFSTLRTYNGSYHVKDSGNDLIFEIMKYVQALRPKAILIENVPALAKDNRMNIFCRKLHYIGYQTTLKVFNAADYGVPQRRKRMILIAGRYGLFEFAEPVSNSKTVRDVIGGLPLPVNSSDPLHKCLEKRSNRIKKLIKRIPRNGGSRMDIGMKYQLECHKRFNGFKDVYGRMGWDDVSPTITTGCINPSKGRFLHPEQNRAITLREAALLQSFPADYYFPANRGRYPVAKMIGNALPPKFVKQHAKEVLKYFKKNKLINI